MTATERLAYIWKTAENGDHLSDSDLEFGLALMEPMVTQLYALGPQFHHSADAIQRKVSNFHSYQFFRGLK